MQRCSINGCARLRPYQKTKSPYCHMHMARFRRHGDFKKKTGSHGLEKLPHLADEFILKHCKDKQDDEIAQKLRAMGYLGTTAWTVRYRRRKLGVRKYEYGEVKKHK